MPCTSSDKVLQEFYTCTSLLNKGKYAVYYDDLKYCISSFSFKFVLILDL